MHESRVVHSRFSPLQSRVSVGSQVRPRINREKRRKAEKKVNSATCLSTEHFFDPGKRHLFPLDGISRRFYRPSARSMDGRGASIYRRASSCYPEFSIDRRRARAFIARNGNNIRPPIAWIVSIRSRNWRRHLVPRHHSLPDLFRPFSFRLSLSPSSPSPPPPSPSCPPTPLLAVAFLGRPVDRSTGFSRGRACSRTTMSERETI